MPSPSTWHPRCLVLAGPLLLSLNDSFFLWICKPPCSLIAPCSCCFLLAGNLAGTPSCKVRNSLGPAYPKRPLVVPSTRKSMGWVWPRSRLGLGIPLKLPRIRLSPHLLTLLICMFSSETDFSSTKPSCSIKHETQGRERNSPSSPGKGLGKTGVSSGWCHVYLCIHYSGGVCQENSEWPGPGHSHPQARKQGQRYPRHTDDCRILWVLQRK